MRWKFPLILPMLTLIALAGPGCGRGEWPYGVEIGGRRVNVELALTYEQRERGLMYREKLDDGWGMLFVFPDERTRHFWMRNTHVPLSIAFIRDDLTVCDVQDMQPLSDELHPSSAPARYALEVQQGWFARHGIGAGATVTFSPKLEREIRRAGEAGETRGD